MNERQEFVPGEIPEGNFDIVVYHTWFIDSKRTLLYAKRRTGPSAGIQKNARKYLFWKSIL